MPVKTAVQQLQMRLQLNSILLALLFSINALTGQPATAQDKLFSVAELKADIQFLKTRLENNHPGLYLYSAKSVIDHVFDSLENGISQPLTGREFYKLISIISSITQPPPGMMGTEPFPCYLLATADGGFDPLPFTLYDAAGRLLRRVDGNNETTDCISGLEPVLRWAVLSLRQPSPPDSAACPPDMARADRPALRPGDRQRLAPTREQRLKPPLTLAKSACADWDRADPESTKVDFARVSGEFTRWSTLESAVTGRGRALRNGVGGGYTAFRSRSRNGALYAFIRRLSQRLHPDRAVGRDRYHRYLGGDPVPGVREGAREGAAGELFEQSQADGPGHEPIRHRLRPDVPPSKFPASKRS